MELEPGPLALIDATALRTFRPPPSFSALAGHTAAQLAGHRANVDAVARDVAVDLPVDVAGAFAGTIAPARDTLGNEVAGAPASPVPALVANGDSNDVIRQSVLPLLPQPDAPFDVPQDAPPELEPGQTTTPTPGKGYPVHTDAAAPPPPAPSGDPVREAIRQDYQSLLGRDPDPGGWDFWYAKVTVEGWSWDQISAGIMDSDEYRNRHGG